MSDVDVVVVGAGHNGLVCAAYLARAGLSVQLIEARDQVGGCASTVDALGARVNICNCDHVMIRTTGIIEDLDLARFGLRYVDLDPCSVGLDWDGREPWAAFHDLDRTIAGLEATRPDQVDAYRRYIEIARPAAELMIELTRQIPSPGRVARRLLDRRARGLRTLLAWSRRSALDVFRSFFSDDSMATPALCTGPTVWGVAPDTPGTGLAALSYALRHLSPIGRPVGGSGALTDALRVCFEAAGGAVRCGSRVARLVTDGGRVRAVELMNGDVIETRSVVTACDPRSVLVDLMDGGDPRAHRLQNRWRSRPVHEGYESKIDAVVDAVPRYRAVTDRFRAAVGGEADGTTWVVAPSIDEMREAHALIDRGRVADRPMMLVNVPSAVDDTMRVPGSFGEQGHVISLEVLFTPYSLAGGWPGSAEPDRWLDSWASLLQDDYRSCIRDWRVMTPPDYERDFNMNRGYTPAFAGSPVTALLGRRRELTRYRTPIPNLFLSGAATYPGAGIWGAPGRNAASVVADALDGRLGA